MILPHVVFINNYKVSLESYIKYIGIMLHNKHVWEPHAANLTTQLYQLCKILSPLKLTTQTCTKHYV